VKIFLDECVDWRLARDIIGHDVKTARQMGWMRWSHAQFIARDALYLIRSLADSTTNALESEFSVCTAVPGANADRPTYAPAAVNGSLLFGSFHCGSTSCCLRCPTMVSPNRPKSTVRKS